MNIETTSAEGVAIAVNSTITRIATRHDLMIDVALITPAKFSSTMKTGTTKATPIATTSFSTKSMYSLAVSSDKAPSGTKPVMSLTMFGSTNQPAAQPARNNGIAVAKKTNVNFRSRVLRPGTRNAKIWYSQTGLETTMPSVNAICSHRSNPLEIVGNTIAVSLLLRLGDGCHRLPGSPPRRRGR